MKNTKIIQLLKEYRDPTMTIMNPEFFRKVLKKAIRKLEKHEAEIAICNTNCSLSDDIIDSGTKELMFANMQIEGLKNVLEEISVITSDPLTKKVADMAIERHKTDKLIHAREIFGNDPVGIDMSDLCSVINPNIGNIKFGLNRDIY